MASQNNMTPECELQLVMAALLGDLQAFDSLVRRYRGAVLIVAREAAGSREMAEDIAQDVFILAFKALPQLTDPARFAGWIYAIARRHAQRVANRLRDSPTESSALDRLILQSCPELTVHPTEECVKRAERAYIPAALEQLDGEYRIPLRLRYYEEWSIQQIGDFLMLPISTVKWRLHKGRLLLRQLLLEADAK